MVTVLQQEGNREVWLPSRIDPWSEDGQPKELQNKIFKLPNRRAGLSWGFATGRAYPLQLFFEGSSACEFV